MRRCLHCKTEFRPKRSDARYCPNNLCRQAAYHMRKKAADTASAAAVTEQRNADALRGIDQLNAHQCIANALPAQAKAAGIEVSFMPASNGVIAVEISPGAFDEAATMIAGFPYLSREGTIRKDEA